MMQTFLLEVAFDNCMLLFDMDALTCHPQGKSRLLLAKLSLLSQL
jgi:hypothetical protein